VSFPGAVVTVGRHGPDGGDSVRGGRERGGVVPMANEERDSAVPGHGGEGRAGWRWRGLGCVKESAGNFGSLTKSNQNPPVMV
jgi:hypothetical protein